MNELMILMVMIRPAGTDPAQLLLQRFKEKHVKYQHSVPPRVSGHVPAADRK